MSTDLVRKIKTLIKDDDLTRKRRDRHLVHKRIFLFSMLKKKGYTYSEIGKLFNLTHATIMHGIKRHQELVELNDLYLKKDTQEYKIYLGQKLTDFVASDLKSDILMAKTLEDFVEIKFRIGLGLY